MIRLTTSVFVAALLRRAQIGGAQALVARHGAEEAGAILISVDRLDGTADLYAPAPQSAFAEPADTDRLFTCVRERAAEAEVGKWLAREVDFDPDVWLVVIEDRQGRPFVDLARV
jgi:hypothetical protein